MLSGVSSLLHGKEEGPYEVVFDNVTSCIKEKPWFRSNLTVQGRHVLRGTFFSSRELKNVKFRVRLYDLGDRPKLKLYETSNLNCRNGLIQLILLASGLRYNREKCAMVPASYDLTDLDLNMIFHTVAPMVALYGPMQVRWEVAAATSPYMCTDLHFHCIPLKEKARKTQ